LACGACRRFHVDDGLVDVFAKVMRTAKRRHARLAPGWLRRRGGGWGGWWAACGGVIQEGSSLTAVGFGFLSHFDQLLRAFWMGRTMNLGAMRIAAAVARWSNAPQHRNDRLGAVAERSFRVMNGCLARHPSILEEAGGWGGGGGVGGGGGGGGGRP